MATYKAAYWTDGKGAEIVLTIPENAHMSAEELIEEALKEAESAGLDLSDGDILVGDWTE